MDERVKRAFTQPGHPVAFSAPGRVAKHFGISTTKARTILESIDGYTLHREYKKPRVYNPYYLHSRRKLAQADLIDVSKLAQENDGVTFLLLIIDCFTKKIWLYPIQRKTAVAMTDAMRTWLGQLDVAPTKLQTDRGLEFTNRQVQALLAQHGVEWQAAYGTAKAAIAERANKSIQMIMYKYMTERETVRYVDKLQQMLATYNSRGHRTLDQMTPDEADRPENENRVQAIFHERYAKIGAKRRSPKLKIGNLVRVKTDAHSVSSSSRSYAEQFHGEFFTIVRINRTLPVPMYHLKSVDTGEYIKGGFYSNELQRQRGDLYKIETVLRERTRRGRRQLFVKWKFFGPRWNEWIDADSVERVY